jgi:hypothetical protein
MTLRGNAILSFISLTLIVTSSGCHRRIGPPNDREELMRPEDIVSFDRLYKGNCSACHGEKGSGGPALDLANPSYQALVDDASLTHSLLVCVRGGLTRIKRCLTCHRTLQAPSVPLSRAIKSSK